MKRSLHQPTAARRTVKGKHRISLVVCALSLCVALASFAALSAPAIAVTEDASDSLGIVDMAETGNATGETAVYTETAPEMTQAPTATPEVEPAELIKAEPEMTQTPTATPEVETAELPEAESEADTDSKQTELPGTAAEVAPTKQSMAEAVSVPQTTAASESAEPEPVLVGDMACTLNKTDAETGEEGPDATITVTCTEEAGVPADAVLNVREIAPDSDEYNDYYTRTVQALVDNGSAEKVEDVHITRARLFDVTILVDGEAFEPAAPVQVNITYADAPVAEEVEEEAERKVVHFATEDDGTEVPEVLDTEVTKAADGTQSVKYEQASFSISAEVEYTVSAQTAAEATPPEDPDPDPHADITDHITNVTYNGVTYHSGIGTDGSYYHYLETQFKLHFENLTKEEVISNNYLYSYELPADITVADKLLNTTYDGYDEQERVGFRFEIVKDESDRYVMQIHFDEEYINTVVSDGSKVKGNAFFTSQIGESYYDNKTEIEIPFSQDVSLTIPSTEIEIPENETSHSSIDVSKSGSYLTIDNQLKYTVKVTSHLGTDGKPVVLEDVMGALPEGITAGSFNVNVQKTTLSAYDQEGEKETITLADDALSRADGSTSFNLTLPALDENERYIVIYTYDLNGKVPAGTTKGVNNSLKASSEGIHKETGATISLSNEPLKKGGWWEEGAKVMHWSIEINNGHNDIAGMQLTDGMFNRLTGTPFTIKNSVTGEAVDPAEYTINYAADNTITGITFNALGSTSANTNSYKIDYTTPAAPVLGNNEWTSVQNTANFNGNSATASGTVGPGGAVVKDLQSTDIDSDGKGTIIWKSSVTIPEGGILSGTVIEDKLTCNSDVTHYMTGTQLNDLLTSEAFTDVFSGKYDAVEYMLEGESEYKASFNSATDANKHIVAFRFTLTSAVPQPAASDTVALVYSSTVDKSTANSLGQFRNDFSVGRLSDYETVPYAGKPVDKSHDSDTTVTKDDPYFYWYVIVQVDKSGAYTAQNYTITDTLPLGVDPVLVSCGVSKSLITQEGTDYRLAETRNNRIDSNGTVTVPETSTSLDLTVGNASVTTNADGKKAVTFTANVGSQYYAKYSEFYVTYKCKLNDEMMLSGEAGTTVNVNGLNNTINVTTTGEYGSDDDSVDLVLDRTNEITERLTKNGTWNNKLHQLEYSLVINPNAEHLGAADTLTLTDVLTYYKQQVDASFDYNSVKLYNAVKDGDELKKGDEITGWKDWKVTDTLQYPDHPEQNHDSTLTATLPNDKALILEYSYKVQATDGGWYETKNKASLSNVAKGEDEATTKYQWQKAEAGGDIETEHTFKLIKVEKDKFGTKLPGAEFTLYKYEDGKFVNTDKVYTTDDNGVISLHYQKPDTEDYEFVYNTAYYLVETKAPDGYVLPENPTQNCFYFSSSDIAAYPEKMPNNFKSTPNVVDVSKASGQVAVENTPVPTYTLPETGGTGTTLYSLGGLALMGVGLLGLTLRKKRERGQQKN